MSTGTSIEEITLHVAEVMIEELKLEDITLEVTDADKKKVKKVSITKK